MSDTQWFPVQLPSLGHYYRGLVPEGRVEVTPWTTVQEEFLYTDSPVEDRVSRLVSQNVRFPSSEIQYEDLLIGDQFFLLVQIRCYSLTPWYTAIAFCPHCSHQFKEQINFQELNVIVSDGDKTEPIDMTLSNGTSVGLRFLRVRDLKAIKDYMAQRVKLDETPSDLLFKKARQVETIRGNPAKIEEKMAFLRSLSLLDSRMITETLNQSTPGLVLSQTLECPSASCRKEFTYPLDLDASFFRPSYDDLRREAECRKSSGDGNELPREKGVLLDGSPEDGKLPEGTLRQTESGVG